MPITNLLAKEDMLPRSKATHVVFLERGQSAVEKLAVEEATRKIENLNDPTTYAKMMVGAVSAQSRSTNVPVAA